MSAPIPFEHKMAAHCETGTLAALLHHAGCTLSEPMIFGLGSGIFFAYLQTKRLPFPMIVNRTEPGKIRQKVAKRLGVEFVSERFRSRDKAQQRLDALLEQQIPVGVQVDMFYMDYIPAYMRAHFNGHYISVLGREEDGAYRVSDCYYPAISRVSAAAMERGRFARGDLAPKGFLYYPKQVPGKPDLAAALPGAIKEACRNMLKLPFSFLGVKGIRLFADKVMTWPELARDEEHLSHEIMMVTITLEERGTGGAGFRYMYATFLQQAAALLQSEELAALSRQMMAIGDAWREVSLFCARIGKRRDLGPQRLGELRQMLLERADEEQRFFTELAAAARALKK